MLLIVSNVTDFATCYWLCHMLLIVSHATDCHMPPIVSHATECVTCCGEFDMLLTQPHSTGTVKRYWLCHMLYPLSYATDCHMLLTLPHASESATYWWQCHMLLTVSHVTYCITCYWLCQMLLTVPHITDINILDVSCPEYLKGFIKLVDHGRNTRNSNNTNILKCQNKSKAWRKILQIQSISSLEWP